MKIEKKNKLCRIPLLLLTMLVFSAIVVQPVFAVDMQHAETKKNEESGYSAIILDNADLLSTEEEEQLLEKMQNLTSYCSAVFVSSQESHLFDVESYAEQTLDDVCEQMDLIWENTTLFIIDMYNRELCVTSGSAVAKIVPVSMANTITDNVYTYASAKNYEACAEKVFEQIGQLMEGQKIAQPMRFITAALLAVFAGLAIALILVRVRTKRLETSYSEMIGALQKKDFEPNISAELISSKRVPHVEVHVSGGGGGPHGGGGGFHGGGGGFGGGGFSGGGGSHSGGASGSHRF